MKKIEYVLFIIYKIILFWYKIIKMSYWHLRTIMMSESEVPRDPETSNVRPWSSTVTLLKVCLAIFETFWHNFNKWDIASVWLDVLENESGLILICISFSWYKSFAMWRCQRCLFNLGTPKSAGNVLHWYETSFWITSHIDLIAYLACGWKGVAGGIRTFNPCS